jgi:hypothetical protein
MNNRCNPATKKFTRDAFSFFQSQPGNLLHDRHCRLIQLKPSAGLRNEIDVGDYSVL